MCSKALHIPADSASRFRAFSHRCHQGYAYPSFAGITARTLAREIAPWEYGDVLAAEQAMREPLVILGRARPEVESGRRALHVHDGAEDVHGRLELLPVQLPI